MAVSSRVGIEVAWRAAAIVTVVAIAGCGRIGAGEDRARKPGSNDRSPVDEYVGEAVAWAPDTLPDGVVLSHWVNGGIEGLAHEVRLTDAGWAELWIFGKKALSMPLVDDEARELASLLRRGRPMMTSESDPPDIADGMGVGLLFAGRGREDADEQVTALASRMLSVARAVAGITLQPVIVIGEPREDVTRKRWSLVVNRVLKAPEDEPFSSGTALVLDAFGPQQAVLGERIWGLARDPSRAEQVVFWRHAAIELEPRIEAVLRRGGTSREPHPERKTPEVQPVAPPEKPS